MVRSVPGKPISIYATAGGQYSAVDLSPVLRGLPCIDPPLTAGQAASAFSITPLHGVSRGGALAEATILAKAQAEQAPWNGATGLRLVSPTRRQRRAYARASPVERGCNPTSTVCRS